MNKKRFSIKLVSNNNKNTFNTIGSLDNKILTYYESDKLRSKITINLDKKTLVKENIDYRIELSFKDKLSKGEIFLKEKGKFIIDIEVKEFKVLKNKVIINYLIIDSKEEILLEIEGELE